jgi:hypothetical protein
MDHHPRTRSMRSLRDALQAYVDRLAIGAGPSSTWNSATMRSLESLIRHQ